MRRNFLSEAQKYIKKNRNRRTWKHIVIALACVVVFCTTYALILPAITTEKDTLEDVVGDAVYQEAVSDTSSDDTATTEDGGTDSGNGETTDNTGETTTPTLGTGEVDFEGYIDKITVEHKQPYGEWQDVGTNTIVKKDDLLRFNIEYTLPGGTLSYENPSIVYNLPNSIKSVKEDSGKVFSDGGEEIGTYTISKDGKIKITFYESYVKSNNEGQPIEGYIKFESSVDQIDKNDKGNIKFTYKENESVVIKVEKEKTGDVSVRKQASTVEDGKVTYTITISSDKGTADKVTLKDVMNNVAYDGEGQFRVVDKNGNEVTNIQAPSADSKEFNLELPKMNAGDQYTITYTAKFDKISNQIIYGNNNVTVTSKDSNDNELKHEAGVQSTFNNKIIQKSGSLSEDKSEIIWTVVVNEGNQDISGYELKDDKYSGKATITEEGGQPLEIDLPYTFPPGSNKKYTITYKTSADRALGEYKNINNTATIQKGTESGVSSEGYVGVPGFYPLSKNAENLAINQDGTTADITWNVSINTNEGDIPAGWKFTESLQGDQWFTEAQKTEIENIFTELGSKYQNTIDWKTNDQNKIVGFEVTFTNKLAKGQDPINITYHSTGNLGDGSSSITFRNGANINNKVWSNGEISYKAVPVVTKYDLKDNNTNDTSYNYDDVTNGILKWGFKVTVPKKADGKDIVITEKLPEGVTLLENEGLKIIDGNTVYAVTFTEGKGTVTINNNHVDHVINITKNDDNSITIEIPKELTVGGDDLKEYKFAVQVKIDDNYSWENKNYSYVGTFKNQVIVKDKDGNELGKDDQTQTVTKNYTESDEVLKKAHEPTTDENGQIINNYYENNIIPYSIVVNKKGQDLLEGSDKLTLKDVFENTYSNQDPVNISLVPGSLHVYKLNSDGTKGDELSAEQMKYTFVVDSAKPYDGATKRTYKLSIEVPDKQALIVEYKYKVDARAGYWLDINNIVSIEGQIEESYVSKDYTKINIVESSAGANIRGVTIYKVDSDNNAIRLRNAEFELYRWDSKTSKYVMVKASDTSNTFVTNSDGKFSIKELAYNTAYKLVEVKAPDGYLKSKKPYYFIIGNSDTESNPISKPSDFDGIEYPGGSVIYISNEIDSTSITVNKKWFKPDGTEVTGLTGSAISFQLWQIANTEESGGDSGGGTGDSESEKVKFSIDITLNSTEEFWKQETISVTKGTVVTLTLKNAEGIWDTGETYYDIYVNGESKKVEPTVDGNTKTYVYTISVSEDTIITGDVRWSKPEVWTHLDLKKVEPEPSTTPSEGSTSGSTETTNVGTLYAEYTIDSKEDWTKTITGLPKEGTNENEEKVYYTYYVLETGYSNYDTSYENNGGITEGTITIKNTLKEKPEYVLPETGRFGGDILFILGGMLLMVGSLVYIYKRKHKRV